VSDTNPLKKDIATDPGSDAQGVIPLLAEELTVTKKKVDTGRVKVSTITREHEQLVDELLAREKVEVERIAVGKPITELPPVREEDDTIVVPVVEEMLVVERRLVLKEEVRIRRVRGTERHQERVMLRKQEAVITRLPTESQPAEASSVSQAKSQDQTEEKK